MSTPRVKVTARMTGKQRPAVVARPRGHERRLARLEARHAPRVPPVIVVSTEPEEGKDRVLPADAPKLAKRGPGTVVIEFRLRSTDAPPPQARRARDAARARPPEVAAERRHADGKDDLDTAGPDPAARARAEAQAREAGERQRAEADALRARAVAALDWLGPEPYLAADKLFTRESPARGIYAASPQDFEAVMRAYIALRSGDLGAAEVQALLARVERFRAEPA